MMMKSQFRIRLLIGSSFLFLIICFMLRSRISSFNPSQDTVMVTNVTSSYHAESNLKKLSEEEATSVATMATACTKIPPSIADAIIHYATSKVPPQQTMAEISVTAQVLKKKSPCNFLVFGLGHDSLMWSALNHGGRTVFFEENEKWISEVRRTFPALESYHVKYATTLAQAEELLELGKLPECRAVVDLKLSKCQLALTGLPDVFYEVEWDLIMVDAPTGYFSGAPGRMGAIYTAGRAARWRKEGETDVFVHDVNRIVEDRFSKAFLCEGYMKREERILRHFTIPSHRTRTNMTYCP